MNQYIIYIYLLKKTISQIDKIINFNYLNKKLNSIYQLKGFELKNDESYELLEKVSNMELLSISFSSFSFIILS